MRITVFFFRLPVRKSLRLFAGILLLTLLQSFSGAGQPLSLQVVSQVAPTACRTENGSVTLLASGGRPGYRYSMDLVNFQRSGSFTGLASGVYTFYLVDASLNFTAVSVSLNGPCAIGIGFSYSLYVCGIGGFIKVTQAFGGSPPYQYALDNNNFGNAKNFQFLLPGMHKLFVKDAAGLVLEYALPMYALCDMALTATLTNASCGLTDGSLVVDVSSGANDYEYSKDGIVFQNAPLFANLAAGVYDITVRSRTDGQTARIFGLRIRSDCPKVTAVSKLETCGRGDGSITAAGSLGTPPYSYSIDGINFSAANVIPKLKTGKYSLVIKDANGFVSSIPVLVGSGCITVTTQAVNPTCNQNNGSITVMATDAVGPYEYSLDGINYKQSDRFENLPAGNYTISVRDSRAVINTETVALINPSTAILTPEATPASCSNDDGVVTAVASGGVAPLQYSLDGISYQEGNRFPGIPGGVQTVYVKDAEGCMALAKITVTINRNLPVDAGADQVICEGTAVTIPAITDATGFSWSPAAGLNDSSLLQPMASPPVTRTYTLTVVKGVCTAEDQVKIVVQPAPVADAGPDQVVCYGKEVTLTGSGGQGFAWNPASLLSAANTASPVLPHAGNTMRFLLDVTGANGCRSVTADTMLLTVLPAPKVFAGKDTIVAPGEPLQLLARDVNGTGFTAYSWTPQNLLNDPLVAGPVATLTVDQTFTVTAASTEGCQGSDQISVRVIRGPEIYVPNAFTPNGDGRNDVLRPVTVGIKTFSSFSVFNRAGQRIFYTSDAGSGWDGRLAGQPQGTGGFVWVVEGTDYTGRNIRRSGTVLLIR